MKKQYMKKSLIRYASLFFGIIGLDRFTKFFALHMADSLYQFTSFLSLKLTFNRGIVWGILNSTNGGLFVIITLGILVVYSGLLFHTVTQYKRHKPIVGEVMVLAGGFSNILDRFFYAGVIDFILISYHDWSWPIFNCADTAIVVGVIIMLITGLLD